MYENTVRRQYRTITQRYLIWVVQDPCHDPIRCRRHVECVDQVSNEDIQITNRKVYGNYTITLIVYVGKLFIIKWRSQKDNKRLRYKLETLDNFFSINTFSIIQVKFIMLHFYDTPLFHANHFPNITHLFKTISLQIHTKKVFLYTVNYT